MADPRAMAARMTGIRCVDHRDVTGGGTPGLGLTGLDVAAAMSFGKAGEAETKMVHFKWAQDGSSEPPLLRLVAEHAAEMAKRERWRVSAERIVALAKMAVQEVTIPHACPTCLGRTQVWPKGYRVPMTCPDCNGVGRRGWREQDRARNSGMLESSWSSLWRRRYERLRRYVEDTERRGLASLRCGV